MQPLHTLPAHTFFYTEDGCLYYQRRPYHTYQPGHPLSRMVVLLLENGPGLTRTIGWEKRLPADTPCQPVA